MAWSQHEIVADYVRPTLMWLEAGGRPAGGETLASLVAKFSTEASGLACLTETQEGCAPRCAADSWLVGGRWGCRHHVHARRHAPADRWGA